MHLHATGAQPPLRPARLRERDRSLRATADWSRPCALRPCVSATGAVRAGYPALQQTWRHLHGHPAHRLPRGWPEQPPAPPRPLGQGVSLPLRPPLRLCVPAPAATDGQLESSTISMDGNSNRIDNNTSQSFADPLTLTSIDRENALDADIGGTAATPSTATSSTASTETICHKRGHKSTSDAWNDFEQLFKDINGKKVRCAAKCLYCKSQLTASSTAGTGHLKQRRSTCASKAQRAAKTQSLIQFNADGSIRSWDYNPDIARTELCRLICTLDLPLGIGSTAAFERYIKHAHNPRFTVVCRQTTTRDFVKFYNESRTSLIDVLKSSVSCVALTSDIWSGNAKEDYISVVAHYVNVDWVLEKRVIGMRLIDVS
jgi:hypothetical protein